MPTTDRRVQRTSQLLQKALIELVGERGYDAITIQDIVDRANVGRTTFYLHYTSKDELFLACHETIMKDFQFGPDQTLSQEELLAPEARAETAQAYAHLAEARGILNPIFQGQNSQVLVRRMRDRSAQNIEASLRAAFAVAESSIPFELLANYLAGAQIALIHWWLEKRMPYSPASLAQALHRLRRAAICDALGLNDTEQSEPGHP